MLQILDTRMGFPSPSLNVVFDYFSHSCLKMCKICLKRNLDAMFGVDVLWRHRWITSGMGLSHPPGWNNISPDVKIGGYSCLKSEKRESHPSLNNLQHPPLGKPCHGLQIMDTWMGFLCPFRNVVIYSVRSVFHHLSICQFMTRILLIPSEFMCDMLVK